MIIYLLTYIIGSTIRMVNLKDGCVKNVVGGDQLQPDDLFAYGTIYVIFIKMIIILNVIIYRW